MNTGLSPCALELVGITKLYGSVEVLRGIDFRVRRGSIHVLLGANGAGKSTLLKIAAGAEAATGGRICVNGTDRQFASPFEARRAGIGMVFQERSLVPELSVSDNIFLNGEIRRGGLVDTRAERREAEEMFEQLGVRIPPSALIRELSIADQQMVEIAKALRLARAVLILDEPTAALTEREVRRLFTIVRQIAKSGVGVIYVSHRLPEVFALGDEVTVLRDGRVVLSTAVRDTSMREIVEAIAGSEPQQQRGRPHESASGPSAQREQQQPVLEVLGLQVDGKLQVVSFAVAPAEILGIAGLVGSGRSTLLKALFGVVPRGGGDIRVSGTASISFRKTARPRDSCWRIPSNRTSSFPFSAVFASGR
jgi:ribose transport system ATP-binding protein